MEQNLYTVLGISSDATPKDIKKAYHQKALKYHPDRNPDDKEAEKKFKEVNAAHDVLSDPKKREAYDRMGHSAFHNQQNGGYEGFSGGDFSSIFEDLFSDFMGGGRNRSPQTSQKGADVYYQIAISLEDAFRGISTEIQFSTYTPCQTCDQTGSKTKTKPTACSACRGRGRVHTQRGLFAVETECRSCQGSGTIVPDPCLDCRGSGRVRANKKLNVAIPEGIQDQSQIRITQKGEAGIRGGASGDLYVQISIKPHSLFERRGHDLYCRYPISIQLAALGGDISVPTIDGHSLPITVPAGTQYGQNIIAKNQGMSQFNRSQRGNLYIQAEVYVPVHLTAKQKKLLSEFDEQEKNKPSETKGFFSSIKNLFKSKN